MKFGEYLQGFDYRELVVIGRTPERVKNYCDQFSGRSASFDKLADELVDADFLFSATSCPTALVHYSMMEDLMKDKKGELVCVDIALPADIESSVNDLKKVAYYNIDDLREISEENLEGRQEEVEKVKVIIDDEIDIIKQKLFPEIPYFITVIN